MIRSNEFPEYFTRFRTFQIYDLTPTRNKCTIVKKLFQILW